MYTKEEQKQHRQELVKALRSGKYSQTRNVLCRSEEVPCDSDSHLGYPAGYCCLGIASDISGLGYWGEYPEEVSNLPGVQHAKPYITPSMTNDALQSVADSGQRLS